jgi:hypothetical protein
MYTFTILTVKTPMPVSCRSIILLYGLFVLLSVSMGSCVLEKEDDNFLDVPKVSDPQYVSNWVYSYDSRQFYPISDTLWLTGYESLYMKPSGGEVYGYEIRMDGQLISSAQSATMYALTAQNLQEGYHRVVVTKFVKTGTGSLADNLKAEYVSYTDEFILAIGTIDFVPEIESFTQEDGTLRLKWKRYPYADFQGYEIRKYDPSSFTSRVYRILTVTGRDEVTFNDSTYVGGNVAYILAVNRGGKYVESKSYIVRFNNNDRLQLMPAEGGKLKLSWSVPRFYKNVSSISVRKGTVVLAENLPAGQTSYTIDETPSPFGQLNNYSVTFVAKVDDPKYTFDQLQVTDNLSIGERTPPYNTLVYNAADKMYYLIYRKQYYNVYPDGFYKLNQNLELVDSARYSVFNDTSFNLAMIASPDGELLYLADNSVLKKVDKNTLSVSESFYIGGYFTLRTLRDNFSVSNNNRIVYIEANNVVALNYSSKQVMLKVPLQKSAHISSDGMYIINGVSLYHYDGANFVLQTTLPYNNVQYVRFLDGSKRVFIATDSRAVIYDYETDAEVVGYSFTTLDGSYAHLEQLSMNFAVRSTGAITLLNLNTGTTKAIPLYEGRYNGDYYMVAGDYLFSNNGGFGLRY